MYSIYHQNINNLSPTCRVAPATLNLGFGWIYQSILNVFLASPPAPQAKAIIGHHIEDSRYMYVYTVLHIEPSANDCD